MNKKHKRFLALSLASIGAIGAFASVSAASLSASTTTKAVRDQVHSEIKQAFAAGDYQAFVAAMKDQKSGDPIITEAQFNIMIQAQKLRASGDMAGAKKLLDDAGIKPPMVKNHGDRGFGKEMTNLTDAQKEAIKQARTLFKDGKKDEAETLLKNAGIKLPFMSGQKFHKLTQGKTGSVK